MNVYFAQYLARHVKIPNLNAKPSEKINFYTIQNASFVLINSKVVGHVQASHAINASIITKKLHQENIKPLKTRELLKQNYTWIRGSLSQRTIVKFRIYLRIESGMALGGKATFNLKSSNSKNESSNDADNEPSNKGECIQVGTAGGDQTDNPTAIDSTIIFEC